MPPSPATLLRRLEAVTRTYGEGRAEAKLRLLRGLSRTRLQSAGQVLRLHEQLCFLRAYPDDAAVLAQVERMLAGFARRADLRRQRDRLGDTGVAGTTIRYLLFWPMALRLTERWPGRLQLEWDDERTAARVRAVLPQIVTCAEAETLKPATWDGAQALERLRAPDESDAAFLVRRIAAIPGDSFTREALHDTLETSYRLDPGPDTPSRTQAHASRAAVVFRSQPPSRERPDLRKQLRRAPKGVRNVSPREGREWIDLALEAMVTRSRDLEAFDWGDPRDVRVVDDGDGLQFVCIGLLPERRPLLHGIYGSLLLRNGVPIGYAQSDALYGSAAVAFNMFETFRGGEAAFVFARVLALTQHLFGARSFSIEPYQLGRSNAEGLESGAWWFYYKLGFRPQDRGVRRVLAKELRRMARRPRHRSSVATLNRLAAAHLFFAPSPGKTIPPPPPWPVGLPAVARATPPTGQHRERALQKAADAAAALLGVRSFRGWTKDERRAWSRFGPLILALPGVSRWNAVRRRSLVQVVRAKGGRRDSDFIARFDAHPLLGRAVLRLARSS